MKNRPSLPRSTAKASSQAMGFEETKAELMAFPKVWVVTGAAGFIGSNLLEALLRLNQKVVGLDNFSPAIPAIWFKSKPPLARIAGRNSPGSKGIFSTPPPAAVRSRGGLRPAPGRLGLCAAFGGPASRNQCQQCHRFSEHVVGGAGERDVAVCLCFQQLGLWGCRRAAAG